MQSGNGPTILGRYFLGLTRDDVGGLRYLWSSNTINNEMADPNSLLQVPPPQPSLVLTSNLSVLQAAALTNNQAALQALFPTLQITSATNLGFAFVLTTNIVAVVTPVNGGYYGQMQTNLVPEITTNLLPLCLPIPLGMWSQIFPLRTGACSSPIRPPSICWCPPISAVSALYPMP